MLRRAESSVETSVDVPVSSSAEPEALHSWDDWFLACQNLGTLLKKYENLMERYYSQQCSKSVEGRAKARSSFLSHHDTAFYDQYQLLPRWMLRKLVKWGILGGLIGVLSGVLYSLVSSGFIPNAVELTLSGGICGVCGVGLLAGLPGVFHSLRIKWLIKQMQTLERQLVPQVGILPPKYRNAQCCEIFYDLYCTYGMRTFSQAVTACDEHLMKTDAPGLYLAVCFNEPYANLTLEGAQRVAGGEVYGVAEAEADPALPKDISTKVHRGVDNPHEQLQRLVGLDVVITQIQAMEGRIRFSGGQVDESSGNHMMFFGPPGTGKTTVARIVTKILYDFGYIRENKCVEIDGGYLKSPYTGETTKRAEAVIRYAFGGVLLIDEAYLLMDGSGSAGEEALGVLIKEMEDHRLDFVVILTGYEDKMNRLLSVNEGLSSRIKYQIYFPTFSSDVLTKIFRQMMRQTVIDGTHYKIERSALDLLTKQFEKERSRGDFGNARTVRNFWEKLQDLHANRFLSGELLAEQRYVITGSDVKAFLAKRQQELLASDRNFLARQQLDASIVSLSELKGRTKSGSEDPDADLSALIGLEVVKTEIERMKQEFDFYGGKLQAEGYHTVFLGPPGTGKTTVAGIMTGYLYRMGVIERNEYLDINGDFLRGQYEGHTGKRTEAIIQYSKGMVLFIDEAYLLSSMDDSSDKFGQEAIGVLLDAMEKQRKDFVVIFAGYEREMEKFLNVNSGLRSRIAMEFHFTSYTPQQMSVMFRAAARKAGFTVDAGVWRPLQEALVEKVKDPRFGNGRYIRSLFEKARTQHISAYANGVYEEYQKFTITADDVISVL